jgi:hypothetical protein
MILVQRQPGAGVAVRNLRGSMEEGLERVPISGQLSTFHLDPAAKVCGIKLQGNILFIDNLQRIFTYMRETSLYSTRSLILWNTIPRIKYRDGCCIPAYGFGIT